EINCVSRLVADIESGSKLPTFRKANGRSHLNRINGSSLRIHHFLVPNEVKHFARSERSFFVVGDRVECDFELTSARGDLQVQGIHIFEVALPWDFAAICLDV